MKNFLQNIVKLSGYELHRTRGRGTLGGAFEHLRARGFSPALIIDGGASDGRWSLDAQRYFPKARYTLVEPLEEYAPALAQVPGGAVVTAALADAEGIMALYLGGAFNSSLRKIEGGETRMVKTITLDSLITDPARTLVKLDLEEAEYPVLAASTLLPDIAAVVLECTFKQLPSYCALMEQKGFVVREIFGAGYRRENGDMFQVDILFINNKVS